MDTEKAKDILLNVIADEVIGTYCIEIQKEVDCSKNCENEDCYLIQAIETVLSELEKKDRIIELMAKELSKLNYIQYCNANNCDYPPCNKEKCIKEYFTNKATDNVGE